MSGVPHTDSTGSPVPATTTRTLIRIGLVLTVLMALVGSVRFARYDWSAIPLSRGPDRVEVVVSDRCTEVIEPYVTSSGRTISPIVVDELQYLSLVEYFRGTPRDELRANCLYDPFVHRSGTSWAAHLLPFEEGLSIGLVNAALMVAALWLMLVTLRVQGHRPRTLLVCGALFALGWNTLFFGGALLVDPGMLALVTLGWYLIVTRRDWLVWPLMFISLPIKETAGILVVVAAAAAWGEYRSGRRSAAAAAGPVVAAAVALVVGALFWRSVLPAADASWNLLPGLGPLGNNLSDPFGLVAFALGVGPLAVPALLQYRRMVRAEGRVAALLSPAVVGVAVGLALTAWTVVAADMSPRHFWVAFPFATSLAADWFAAGRPRSWLDRLPLGLVVGRADTAPAGG
jgi:hypothetical protein